MNKKAQIAGQVFIFILAAVLAAMLIFYGYRAINSFTKRTEDIVMTQFQTDIEIQIKTISSDYGSVRKLELSLPSKYRKLCLVNLDYNDVSNSCICDQNFCLPDNDDYNPIICDAWIDKTQNVFLVPSSELNLKVTQMEIEGGYLCAPVLSGKVTLRIEGGGDHTKVSLWTNN